MKWRITLVTSLLLLSFAACKKDKNIVKPVDPAVLSVKLGSEYLGINEVDSAFAIWMVNGQEQRIKMNTRNDSLLADMKLFVEGNGELTIHIFSNKKYRNQYFGQWVFKKTVALKKSKALHYPGPTSFNDVNWLPRVELSDAIGHRAIIALRPDDAYFLIKDPGHNITKLTVDRGYWKTVDGLALAGGDRWICTTACTDQVNEEFFKSLPGRIGNNPWNHISIVILFEINNHGQGWILSLEHEP